MLRQLSFMSVALLILMGIVGCAVRPDYRNARNIREYLMKQFENDSTERLQRLLLNIDTLKLDSDSVCKTMYDSINNVGFSFLYSEEKPKAVRLYKGMIDILENSSSLSKVDRGHLLNMYVKLGASFSDGGMPSISLDYYMKGLNICRDSIDDIYKAMLYNNVGVLYANVNLKDKASEYFRKALEINLAHNVHHEAFLNYANLAELYAAMGEYDKAQQAAQHSLDHLNARKYPIFLADMRVQQGDLYSRQLQYDVAALRYNSALKQYADNNFISGVIETQIHLSDLYLRRELPDSALFYANTAFIKAKDIGRPEYVVKALKQLSAVKESVGEFEEAVRLVRESNALADSLKDMENLLRLQNWEKLGKDALPVFANGNAKSQKDWIWIVIGLIIIAGAAVWMVIRIRKRIQKNAIVEVHSIKNKLNIELDQRNRELTALSLDKVKMSEGVSNVCDDLKNVLLELNPRETAKRDHLRSLLAKLEHLTSENGDKEFKLFFERVHPDFYKKLVDHVPDLTSRDLRLCAFIYLGMNTKEIATLTYREVRSVESARNRLRKKLGLENNDELSVYLHSIVES